MVPRWGVRRHRSEVPKRKPISDWKHEHLSWGLRRPLHFTWRTPWIFRTLISGNWVDRINPLPPAQDQRAEKNCIVRATYAMLNIRVDIMANRERKPPRHVSKKHLNHIFKLLTDKTVEGLYEKIEEHGVVEWGHFAGRDNPQTPRIYLDHKTGYGPEALYRIQRRKDWIDKIEKELLLNGPLVGTFSIKTDYNKGEILYVPNPKLDYVQEGTQVVGHVVLLTGWRRTDIRGYEGTNVMEYLNSYGLGYGRDGGYGEIHPKNIHYVHMAEVRNWW